MPYQAVFVPFPLMENEPKRSRPSLPRNRAGPPRREAKWGRSHDARDANCCNNYKRERIISFPISIFEKANILFPKSFNEAPI